MPEAPLDERSAAATPAAIVQPPLRAGRGKPSASSQEVEPFQPLAGWQGGAGGIGGLLARSTHATSSPYAVNGSAFYHADGNGNITYLLKSDGSAYANYKYDPYGRTLSSAGTLASANLLRFSSKPVVLSATGGWGAYYYGYRFYDPNTQRWINRDPLEEEGGMNLYVFVKNQPSDSADPLGLSDFNRPPELIIPPGHPDSGAYYGPTSPEPQPYYPGEGMDLFDGASMVLAAIDLADSMVSPGPDASLGIPGLQALKKVCKQKLKKPEPKPRSPFPPGGRFRYKSRKDARDAAARASPVGQAKAEKHGPHGPHYHPLDAKGDHLEGHDHYYFPDRFLVA